MVWAYYVQMTTEREPPGASGNDDDNTQLRCPHSDEKQAPACWDCTEEGRHIDKRGSAGISPSSSESTTDSWASKIKKNWTLGTGNQVTGRPDPTLEVYHPEPGLELDQAPHARWSQPGLEVSSGPTLVSDAEKRQVLKAGALYKHGRVVSDEKEHVPTKGRTIWGVQRRVCFLFLVVVVVIVVAAITLGVVLGLKQSRGSGDSSE